MRSGPFEWVIIDTPPVLAVTDASILARQATGVAFVLGAGMTRRRVAERAIETLAIGGPRILGAVLNRVAAVARDVLLLLGLPRRRDEPAVSCGRSRATSGRGRVFSRRRRIRNQPGRARRRSAAHRPAAARASLRTGLRM